MRDIAYYLARGFEPEMAEYFANGRRTITAVSPNADFTLTLDFDNGEKRKLDCKTFLEKGTVFEVLMEYKNFERVYLDENACISWDKDPNVDSRVVWNNKIDLCPDNCYVNSIPVSD